MTPTRLLDSLWSSAGPARLVRAACLLLVLILCGCPNARQPWAGQAYQPPENRSTAGQHTYTPTPRILPGIRVPSLNQADEDAAIERMLGIDPDGTQEPLLEEF